jgi:hypothetical protein
MGIKMNHAKRAGRNNRIAKALRSKCAKMSIPVGGSFVKATDLAKSFEAASKALDEAALLRAQYLAAVETARALDAQVSAFVSPIKNFVVAAFGERSEASAAFGFEPRKTAYVTVEKRALAVEKTLATRAARHTMGSRQRAQIHGTVEDLARFATSPTKAGEH